MKPEQLSVAYVRHLIRTVEELRQELEAREGAVDAAHDVAIEMAAQVADRWNDSGWFTADEMSQFLGVAEAIRALKKGGTR